MASNNSSDEDYCPPKPQWKKPVNFDMLKGKKKKNAQKSKVRFDCDECDKRFTSKDSLKSHRKSVHGLCS